MPKTSLTEKPVKIEEINTLHETLMILLRLICDLPIKNGLTERTEGHKNIFVLIWCE